MPAIFRKLFLVSSLFVALYACNSSTNDAVSPTATITGLSCGSATFSATALSGTAYTATATLPYTGGNGAAYAAATAIASTGITGLNATLQAGTLANGSGSLTYSLSGTPSGSGTATFAISFGGQSCNLALTVSASTPSSNTANCTTATGVANIVCLAEAFKATLSASQLATAQLAYTRDNVVRWSNLPQALYQAKRLGIAFSSLSATQLAAAKALVQAATGSQAGEGYAEVQQLLLADDYLNANGGGSTYGSGNYYIALLGTPSLTDAWQLQFGGHHLAVAMTYKNGTVVGATPYFEAIEPASFVSNGTTIQAMGNEQAGMVAMLAGLSATQLTTAKLTTSLTDILMGPGKDGQFPTAKSGLAVSGLTTAQKALVLAAMKPWVQDVDNATAAELLKTYESELDQTYIAYSGTTALNSNGDYARIDGPSVWIEFSGQGGIVIRNVTHFHTIWRDRKRDYGANFTF
ncbi:DUF3500 domain-containing protein [Spirosoma sordidisoli]|uniref:DUF3500 domain-containing protein n=1 Tax=Spirosoma sordidisoli TaxID=2502893 RepID=A0A4Q2UR30_9BACT|nr:DUF3500 domain-containing protein [Spirosoma sordidisoli]RYC69269.1 DUF3500 domain-containing protein [Spirosoma sordidisoli]